MRTAFLALAGVSLMASEPDTLNLLEDLSSASEISTRTKLNIDKTPAIVSVLHADHLKTLGVNNLFEALETVPGIETSMGTAGAKQINMRGNKSIVRDKLKLMINGISVNAEVTGASFFYLDMPLEMIERIEVVRGPASALYGSFAHIGAINVITKNSTESNGVMFANGSSEGYGNGGFMQHFTSDEFRVSLDGFYVENDKTRTYGPYDLIPAPTAFTSYEDYTNGSIGLNLTYGDDLSFQARWLELDLTNHFGYGEWPIVQDPKSLESTSAISELRYTPQLDNDLSLDIKAGYKQYIIDGAGRFTPYSVYGFPHDLIASGYIEEAVQYGDVAANYRVDAHQLLGGLYYARAKIVDTYYYVNMDPLNTAAATSDIPTIPNPILPDNVKREQYALYLHDIYTISDKWVLNVGARYDHYSDADAGLAPKAALLYNHSDHDSYKLMYQRSFRTPTFIELYGTAVPLIGNATLETETIDTIEFAFSRTNAFDDRFSANLFYSELQDFIETDNTFTYMNGNDIQSYGVELEWFYPLDESASLQTNYSYVRAKEKDGEILPFFANHLANVLLTKKWDRHWQSGTVLRHVGKRRRENADTREALDAYTRVDQTVTYHNDNFSIQASVKNLFDEDIRYPAQLGNGVTSGTYVNDFPRDGRTFWVSLQWRLP